MAEAELGGLQKKPAAQQELYIQLIPGKGFTVKVVSVCLELVTQELRNSREEELGDFCVRELAIQVQEAGTHLCPRRLNLPPTVFF